MLPASRPALSWRSIPSATRAQGGEVWNAALPQNVEAFFYDVARRGERVWGGAPGNARAKREGFLRHWKLDPKDVPLLEFDRNNWQTPFAELSESDVAAIHAPQG